MNKYIFWMSYILMFMSAACENNHELKAEKNLIGLPSFIPDSTEAKPIKLDLEKSNIRWRGTKMVRTAGHEGIVDIKEGFLLFKNDSLVGGRIIADMHTVRITGKSDYKETYMRKLSNYLKQRALVAEKYPLASFEISQVSYLGEDSLRVWGRMRIKEVTKGISFPAGIKRSGKNQSFYAELSLDRFEWNVGVDGNLLEVNLVDKEFMLMINVVTGEEEVQASSIQWH